MWNLERVAQVSARPAAVGAGLYRGDGMRRIALKVTLSRRNPHTIVQSSMDTPSPSCYNLFMPFDKSADKRHLRRLPPPPPGTVKPGLHDPNTDLTLRGFFFTGLTYGLCAILGLAFLALIGKLIFQ